MKIQEIKKKDRETKNILINIAKNMKAQNIDIDVIVVVTGLTKKEIENL